jgi:hypothetical protein
VLDISDLMILWVDFRIVRVGCPWGHSFHPHKIPAFSEQMFEVTLTGIIHDYYRDAA